MAGLTLTVSGGEGLQRKLLLDAIADFLNTDEVKAPPSLTAFRSSLAPFELVNLEISEWVGS